MKFVVVPFPLQDAVEQLLGQHAGWGRGIRLGKTVELLRIHNPNLVQALVQVGGVPLPAAWRSFNTLPSSIAVQIATAFPNQTFTTVGDFLSHLHGHDDWND